MSCRSSENRLPTPVLGSDDRAFDLRDLRMRAIRDEGNILRPTARLPFARRHVHWRPA